MTTNGSSLCQFLSYPRNPRLPPLLPRASQWEFERMVGKADLNAVECLA